MDAPSYQTILREELAHRQSRNAGYSLRAFARDLGVGVSTLNEVLHEVKGISRARARQLATRLGLADDLRELFVLSARAQHSRSAVEREAAAEALAELTAGPRVEPPQTLAIVSWVVEAILRLSERKGTTVEASALARVLGVSQSSVRFGLRFLTRLGFLEGVPRSRAFLAFLGAGRRINIDYEQLLSRVRKAVRQPSASDQFWNEPLLLDARGVEKAAALLDRCIEDIKRLEDNGRGSRLVYFTGQLFQASDLEPNDKTTP